MFIEPKPFPYLEQDQFVGNAVGDIVYFEDSVPEEKREWLRDEYKKWWKERQEELIKTNRV